MRRLTASEYLSTIYVNDEGNISLRFSVLQAEHLMDRVRESGLEFPESSMLEKHLGAVNEWLNRAQAALAGSVQLRELEKLLAEAEKLAVEPGPKLPELQAKMDKALAWLEKVRKAVPKQRSTRRTMDAEVEKVHRLDNYPADAQCDVPHAFCLG